MSEKQMWEYLRPKLAPLLKVERITERLNEGVSDVVYARSKTEMGWVELKVTSKPRGRIPWKSPAQPLFLTSWAARGVRAGVLVRVEEDNSFWYWRADGTIEWNRIIQTDIVWAAPTAILCPFKVEELVEVLCR